MNNYSSKKIKCTVVGRGAIGAIYCRALSLCDGIELNIAAPHSKVERYKNEDFRLNSQRIEPIEYSTPKQGDIPSDIILITTKWCGYSNALELIRPIVGENTTILPLLNGLLPYELAAKKYGKERVKRGYYVGCTATRCGNDVTMSGFYETVIEDSPAVESLFQSAAINYRIEKDMDRARWLKFIINLGYNHTTALNGGITYGELKNSEELLYLCRALMSEGASVACASGVAQSDSLVKEAMSLLPRLMDSDYGSMAQDVRAGRETERQILGDDLVNRAKVLGVATPLFDSILSKGVFY